MEEQDRNPIGRPTVWTEETEGKIFEALEHGLSRRRACHYAKISNDTLCERLKTDAAFSEKCLEYEACGVMVHARRIKHATELPKETAHAAVTAAKYYLGTHDREAFAEKVHVEHSGSLTLSDLVSRVLPHDDGPGQ